MIRSQAQADLFTRVTGIPCVAIDRTGRLSQTFSSEEYPCRLCRIVSSGDRIHQDSRRHLPWVEEAVRHGGMSIFLCENSFTHWTAPILVDRKLAGALVAGPVLTIEEEDFFEQELLPRLEAHSSSIAADSVRSLFEMVPRVPPGTVTAYSELLRELAIAASDSRAPFDEASERLANQSRMGEYIHELKRRSPMLDTRPGEGDDESDARRSRYPVQKEAALLDQIRSGDVSSAQQTLNELLGTVFFETGDMGVVRTRAQELVVLLSRAVLTEGADPEEVFGMNYKFVDAIRHQDDVNGVAYWMARIVRRFSDLVLYLPHLGHARALRRVVHHLRRSIHRQTSVSEAAEIAGLSVSHFSRVFHEEMGETYVAYGRRIRCERAADLLRDTELPVVEIASRCGYDDHSYFSRVFKKVTGRSPSDVREGAHYGYA